MEAVRQAFRQQIFYWMKYSAKAVKITKERLAQMSMSPFSSSLAEGPLQKGLDIAQGGAWYTMFGLWLSGLADTADSLGVIDKLIYRDKMITWDQLLEATKANWKGFENLRRFASTRYLSMVMMMTMPIAGQPGSLIHGKIVLTGLIHKKS